MSSQRPTHPTALSVWAVLVGVSYVLFSRFPSLGFGGEGTGFVFDEQEAILFNPYLQGEMPISTAFRLDFWGLPAHRSIGSYRPLPNLIWRASAELLDKESPLSFLWLNPLLHGTNAFLLHRLVLRWMAGRSTVEWRVATLSALFFVVSGPATEVVSSVVGLADLLVVAATLLSLRALTFSPGPREVCVFLLFLIGLLSKETMLAGFLPIVLATLLPPALGRARRGFMPVTIGLALLASVVVFVAIRTSLFTREAVDQAPLLTLDIPGLDVLLAWMGQPRLPIDVQNNPLLGATTGERIATGLRVTLAGLLQMVLPVHLSADYSFPRIVPAGFDAEAILGALVLGAPFALVLGGVRGMRVPGGLSVLGYALLFLPLTLLPTSNLLVLLPTIRAERLLYLPLLGASLAFGHSLGTRFERDHFRRLAVFLVFLSAISSRAHALHYQSDVLFWRAASLGAPASAKAHLNLGVMLGARGDLAGQLRETTRAVSLAPEWGLARVYLGDAKCRGSAPETALPDYLRGLALEPNSKALASLALQCLWVRGQFDRAYDPLLRVAAADPDGWLAYLLGVLAEEGEENSGLPPRYRPRGYNQGGVPPTRREDAAGGATDQRRSQ